MKSDYWTFIGSLSWTKHIKSKTDIKHRKDNGGRSDWKSLLWMNNTINFYSYILDNIKKHGGIPSVKDGEWFCSNTGKANLVSDYFSSVL